MPAQSEWSLTELHKAMRPWNRALWLYVDDVRAGAQGKRARHDETGEAGREALADLRGSQRQIRHLCSMLDLDPVWVSESIERYIGSTLGKVA